MSALGQKRTSEHVQSMSALPPKADIGTGPRITFGAPTPAAWRCSLRSAAPRRWWLGSIQAVTVGLLWSKRYWLAHFSAHPILKHVRLLEIKTEYSHSSRYLLTHCVLSYVVKHCVTSLCQE